MESKIGEAKVISLKKPKSTLVIVRRESSEKEYYCGYVLLKKKDFDLIKALERKSKGYPYDFFKTDIEITFFEKLHNVDTVSNQMPQEHRDKLSKKFHGMIGFHFDYDWANINMQNFDYTKSHCEELAKEINGLFKRLE